MPPQSWPVVAPWLRLAEPANRIGAALYGPAQLKTI